MKESPRGLRSSVSGGHLNIIVVVLATIRIDDGIVDEIRELIQKSLALV